MSVRLIPYEALKSKGVPYSKPHLWRLEKAGKFPRRVPIGAGRYAYVEHEIDDITPAWSPNVMRVLRYEQGNGTTRKPCGRGGPAIKRCGREHDQRPEPDSGRAGRR